MAVPRFIQGSLSGPGLVEGVTVAAGGVLNAEKIPSLDVNGLLAVSMMPVGVIVNTQTLIASESLAIGNLVNVWNNAGTGSVRKADAATNRPANGFVLAAYSAAASALVYFNGSDNQLTGMTPGTTQYLGAAGATVSTMPTTAGYTLQSVGTAASATTMNFEAGTPTILA